MESANEFIELPTPKDLDIIGDLRCCKGSNQVLVSSWDSKVLLYDYSQYELPQLLHEYSCGVPVLSIEYLKGNVAYMGALDGNIYQIDYENARLLKELFMSTRSGHNIGVNNLRSMQNNLLVATNFNKEMIICDPRHSTPIHEAQLSNKIYKMDTTDDYVVLGMADRCVHVYDKRNWSTPFQVRESGLKLQTNDLKTFPNGEGFAIASIDGRVSVEYFDPSPEVQEKKYAFKCHRQFDKLTQTDIVYPVNSMVFNTSSKHLYTAGSDGCLNVWNWETRRRIKQYPKFKVDETPQSIVKVDLNYDNSLVCLATSDDSYKTARSLEYSSSQPNFSSKIYLKKV